MSPLDGYIQFLGSGPRSRPLQIAHVNTRLPHLADRGLVENVGPAEWSGLYELTERGEAALYYRDVYGEKEAEEFGGLVADVVDRT